MTPQQEQIIKDVFKENYEDLGLYRWVSRNVKAFFRLIQVFFCLIVVTGIIGYYHPTSFFFCTLFAVLFVLIGFSVGIDHILIGISIRKVMSKLKSKGVFTSWAKVTEVVNLS